MLSEHLRNVGSVDGEIMARFVKQLENNGEKKSENYDRVDTAELSALGIDNAQEGDGVNENKSREMEEKYPSDSVHSSAISIHGIPVAEMNHRADPECDMRKVREATSLFEERLAAYETMGEQLENANASLVALGPEKSKGEMEVVKLREMIQESEIKESMPSNHLSEAKTKEANKAASVEADAVLTNGNKHIAIRNNVIESTADEGVDHTYLQEGGAYYAGDDCIDSERTMAMAPRSTAAVMNGAMTTFDSERTMSMAPPSTAAVMNGATPHTIGNGFRTSSGCELLRDGTLSRSLTLHDESSEQDGEDVVLHDDQIDEDQVFFEACTEGETEMTLTAAYEEFEKRRQTLESLLPRAVDDNVLIKDADMKLADSPPSNILNPVATRKDGDKPITSKGGGEISCNLRRHNMKMITGEEDVIDESLLSSRRGITARHRWSSDGVSNIFRTVETSPSLQKSMRRRSLPSITVTRVKQMVRTKKHMDRAFGTNMIEATIDMANTSDLLESETLLHRKKSHFEMGAASKHSNFITEKKRKVECTNLNSSRKKRKVTAVVDLFGDTDSLFGCKIIKSPGVRKELHSGKKSNLKDARESNTTMNNSNYIKSTKVGKQQIGQSNRQFRNTGEKCGPRNAANSTSTERVHSFQRVLFQEGFNDEGENAGRGGIRRSGRARQHTKFFHKDFFEGGIRNDDDDDDDISPDGFSDGEAPAAVRRMSSRSTAFRGKMKDPSDSLADLLLKSVVPTASDGGCNRKRRGTRRQSLRRSSLKACSSVLANEEEDSDDDEDIVMTVSVPRNNQSNTAIVDIHRQINRPDSSQDDQSISTTCGASCSFGSFNDDENASFAQPMYDVYFGLEDEQSAAAQPTSPMLEHRPKGYQNLHDVYFGQESGIDTDDDEDYVHLPTHGVYFGLDDSDSCAESQLGNISLTGPITEIPYHDSYFGQETYLEEGTDIQLNEMEQVATRIPRCTIRSKPLLVVALLAGMLSRVY